MSEEISRTLLRQRVRNRIIDVLEIAASFDHIARFGSYEVIHRWEDWYHGPDPDFYATPVFSPEEVQQIVAFASIWNETAEVEEPAYFKAEQPSYLMHWQRFRAAAEAALAVFEKRGRFSEDEEQF